MSLVEYQCQVQLIAINCLFIWLFANLLVLYDKSWRNIQQKYCDSDILGKMQSIF